MTVARFLVVSLNTGKVFEYDHESEVHYYQTAGRFTVVDTKTGKYWSQQGGGKEGYITGHPKLVPPPPPDNRLMSERW